MNATARSRGNRRRALALGALVAVVIAPALSPVAVAGPVCPWDLDGDDQVGITELLALLGQWGSDPGGPPDFDGNGTVDINDLLELLANWGPCPGAGPCGDPKAGSCYQEHAAPGCSDLACCELVCAIDPDCCAVAWDAGCKALANAECGNCGDPRAGDCCAANGTPGCSDADCCRIICGADPFCCQFAWDELCAADAQVNCKCP